MKLLKHNVLNQLVPKSQYMFVNNNKQPQALFFKTTSSQFSKLSNGSTHGDKTWHEYYIISMTTTCLTTCL